MFLDMDGTLVRHVDRPDGVKLDDGVRDLLERLSGYLDGAVALVSGRSIASIDCLLHPLRMDCLAGLHGAEFRAQPGDACTPNLEADPQLAAFAEKARATAQPFPGAAIEAHGPCLYLHWRAAPAAAAPLSALAEEIGATLPTHRLHRGLHGIEIRPLGIDKGVAIRRFMQQAPFAGRVPAFAGDDPADEPGFEAVNRMGGISVRVGAARDSSAQHALADPEAVLDWLVAHEVAVA